MGIALAAAAGWVVAVVSAGGAQAQVYGSLANFDVVNDTGYEAHGFEIEIDDPSYDRSKIYSVFGLDRNFGVPPESVERYGAPTIEETPGVGVKVRYEAAFAGGQWSVGTPTGPYANPGDSCWPRGNPLYTSGTLTCDHFGVATYGLPARVVYSWLVDTAPGGQSGVLTPIVAEVPAVRYAYQPQPPAPGEPQAPEPVEVEIEAHDEPGLPFGPAYWVKVYLRHADHVVELEDLMVDNAEVPGESEVEIEWELFQSGGDQDRLQDQILRDPEDASLVLRFEFYEYAGALKPDGEADCSGKNGQHGPDDCGGLGDYVGAQMAAFAAALPPAAVAVPALPSWAQAFGTVALGAGAARARRRRGRA